MQDKKNMLKIHIINPPGYPRGVACFFWHQAGKDLTDKVILVYNSTVHKE